MGRALKVFYLKSDNQIVWTFETHSPDGKEAICPVTAESILAELPDKMPNGETILGGLSEDYDYIEVEEPQIDAYFASDTNEIIDNELIVGKPRKKTIEQPPEPPRDLNTEIDELRARIAQLEGI